MQLFPSLVPHIFGTAFTHFLQSLPLSAIFPNLITPFTYFLFLSPPRHPYKISLVFLCFVLLLVVRPLSALASCPLQSVHVQIYLMVYPPPAWKSPNSSVSLQFHTLSCLLFATVLQQHFISISVICDIPITGQLSPLRIRSGSIILYK